MNLAAFALRHKDVLDDQTRRIRQERSRLFDAMSALDGVCPYPSDANFILVRMPHGQAGPIFEALKARGVLVKKHHDVLRTDGLAPITGGCVDTLVENDRVIRLLNQSSEHSLTVAQVNNVSLANISGTEY